MDDVEADEKIEHNNEMYVFPSTMALRLNLHSPLAINRLLFYITHRVYHWSHQIVSGTHGILKHFQTLRVSFTATFVVLVLTAWEEMTNKLILLADLKHCLLEEIRYFPQEWLHCFSSFRHSY